MNDSLGEVIELFISKKENSTRTKRTAVKLDSNGIINDKFYAKNLERSVLLTSVDSYELALKSDIKMSYGALGENILIDYNPYDLPMGTELQIGEVIVKITQNCTICNHLSSIDEILPDLLKDDRGIFVKVIQDGSVEKGDKVYLLQ